MALSCYVKSNGALKYEVKRADEESRGYILARMHARSVGRCEYSNYWLGWAPGKKGVAGGAAQYVEQAVEVDHRVEIQLFSLLMVRASKALAGAARGYHLPWSAGAQAWVAAKANCVVNLAAVNADAHARKTALGIGFCKAVEEALASDKLPLPYVEAHYSARLLAQRGAKAGVGALRATYARELAHTYVLLSLKMTRELPSAEDVGEHGGAAVRVAGQSPGRSWWAAWPRSRRACATAVGLWGRCGGGVNYGRLGCNCYTCLLCLNGCMQCMQGA